MGHLLVDLWGGSFSDEEAVPSPILGASTQIFCFNIKEIIMSFGLLFIIMVICFVLTIAFILMASSDIGPIDTIGGIIIITPLLLGIFLGFWLLAFTGQSYRLESTIICPIVQVGNTQCIVFLLDDSQTIVNLTEKYKIIYPQNTKFKVRIYSKGPYAGITMENRHIEYEVVQ